MGQLSYALALDIYRDTRAFPADERYGLVKQMRGCATSVPANIAEGSRRATNGEFRQSVGIAAGSNPELDVFLRLSSDLDYMSPDLAEKRRAANTRIGRMLRGLFISLRP